MEIKGKGYGDRAQLFGRLGDLIDKNGDIFVIIAPIAMKQVPIDRSR